jgi:RHS repeat-associated protein
MYRLNGKTTSGGTTVVSNVSYNAANQLLTINYPTGNETRADNSLNQLTSLSVQLPYYPYSYPENLTYNSPTTGTNNGKISSMNNAASGETITYTYDSLNRLLTASCNGTASNWGGFDGFGNLLSMTITAGSAPSLSQAVSATTNQIVGYTYDANGNMNVSVGPPYVGYDVENRLSNTHGVQYGDDAQNKRTWSWTGSTDLCSQGNPNAYLVSLYSPTGQKLATYEMSVFNTANSGLALTLLSTLHTSDQYFGSRRLAVMDQLGSTGTFYPFGENKGSTNPQDTWSFATYWQDSASGLDYANNRYYSSRYGRFMTPDPSRSSGGPNNPQSWNRYAYVSGDPVNFRDPGGLMEEEVCAGMTATPAMTEVAAGASAGATRHRRTAMIRASEPMGSRRARARIVRRAARYHRSCGSADANVPARLHTRGGVQAT